MDNEQAELDGNATDKQLVDLEQRINEAIDIACEALRDNLEDQITDLQDERDRLKRRCDELEDRCGRIERDVEDKEYKIRSLENEISSVKRQTW